MDINKEKISALNNIEDDNHNPGYNISKDTLNNMNSNMSNISTINKDEIKEVNGIKTRKKTKKQYDKIWSCFKSTHAESFKKYMGYGIEDIEKIGFKEFIDFIDWQDEEDIIKYRTDRVKVIPCQDCHNHFTTFQIDFGLCPECAKNYDLVKFGEVCQASDEINGGSSGALIIMFTYMDDFRKMYNIFLPFEDKCEMCITYDDLVGVYTYDFINSFIGDNDKEQKFIDVCYKLPMKVSAHNRLLTIKNILLSEETILEKKNRLEIFLKV